MLIIPNHHIASCGVPPTFEEMTYDYLGYFENKEGEQFVFLFRNDTLTGSLYCGDAEWNEYIISGDQPVDLIMNSLA